MSAASPQSGVTRTSIGPKPHTTNPKPHMTNGESQPANRRRELTHDISRFGPETRAHEADDGGFGVLGAGLGAIADVVHEVGE